MAGPDHSVLLKYLLDRSKMSETKPDIESNVPKTQELRDSPPSDELIEVKEEFSYSPVITVTKEETTLTKGDLKLQKVVVSEDIADQSITITKTVTVRESSNPNEIQSEVESIVQISASPEQAAYNNNKQEKENGENEHKQSSKTKIPTFKSKGTVEKVKKDEVTLQEKTMHEPFIGMKLRSAIPRLKDIKLQNSQNEPSTNGAPTEQQKQDSPKPDDEFDKIYENISTPEKLADAEIVDSIFEEIIHAYDEKAEVTEKVRSKIPLLKRKSEHEIVIPTRLTKIPLKKSYSIDDSKVPQDTKKVGNIDYQSSRVSGSAKSGSYSLDYESESTSTKNIDSNENKDSFAESVKIENNAKTMEFNKISAKEETKTVTPKEVSKCKIPVKSTSGHRTETKINSGTLNRLPKKEAITAIQKVATEITSSISTVQSNIEETHIKRQSSQDKQTVIQSTSKINTEEDDSNQNNKILTASNKTETTISQEGKVKVYDTKLERNLSLSKERENIRSQDTNVNTETVKTYVESSINNKTENLTKQATCDKSYETGVSNNSSEKEVNLFSNKNLKILKTSSNVENISRQISTSTIERVTEYQSNTLSRNEITSIVQGQIQNNSKDDIAPKVVLGQNSEKIVVAFNENEILSGLVTHTETTSSFDLSDKESKGNISQTERTHVTNVSTANTNQSITQQNIKIDISDNKVSENAKSCQISSSVNVENKSTSIVKETVRVATLEFDGSLDFKSAKIRIKEANGNKHDIITNTDLELKQKECMKSTSPNENSSETIFDEKKIICSQKTELLRSNEDIPKSIMEIKKQDNENANKKEDEYFSKEGTDYKILYENLNKSGNKKEMSTEYKFNTDINTLKSTYSSTLNNLPTENTTVKTNSIYSTQNTKSDETRSSYKENFNRTLSNAAENKNSVITPETLNIKKETVIDKSNFNQKFSSMRGVDETKTISQIKNIEQLDEEDIILLKGKVSRIISRLDSREFKVNKTDDDIPKNISVVTKIAIFEKSAQVENPKLKEELHTIDDKPKIVNELLKTDNLDYNQNIKAENTNVHSFETNISDYNKNDKASDFYTLYNSVHTSVVNRLNSIEMRAKKESKLSVAEEKTNLIEGPKNITKFDKTGIKRTDSEVFVHKDSVSDDFNHKKDTDRRSKSLAEVDLGNVMKGRVRQMVSRMNSIEKINLERRNAFDRKDKTRGSVLSRAALFERKVVPVYSEENVPKSSDKVAAAQTLSDEELQERIAELTNARVKYGKWDKMPTLELRDGTTMPVLAVGTALLQTQLIKYIVSTAIDLGYRAIDTAFIYGNEKQVGEAIHDKILDGTVKREDLFIISKLWSTFHRRDLVEVACKNSLKAMGLDYFDLYMIHNPMSFREGPNPLPKIANVLQYSEHDYLEAWYGIEGVIRKGLARRGGVSNFNSLQIDRVVEKGKIKPVINQVECHPYLTQHNLDEFCSIRKVKMSCFSVLGSKGTPANLKSGLEAVIDDPLVKVMAAGLGVTPAQLLIAYQIHLGRNVVVKSSTGAHLWDNLQALNLTLDSSHISALNALNKNKRSFTFVGMGDTHRNYPFKIAF